MLALDRVEEAEYLYRKILQAEPDDAAAAVNLAGQTTIEEVLSVTTVHEMETTEAKPAHAAPAAEVVLPRSLI